MITLQVLEALLSNDAHRRQAAEAHFQSVDVNERVLAWPSVWHQATQQQQQLALFHMIAVLWRRDILQCNVTANHLAPLLEPLQQIFVSGPFDHDKVRSAIGHCLAEVVALVQSSAALEQSLQATESMVSSNQLAQNADRMEEM